MANIKTREKVVIGVMGIAVLYAAFEFLMPRKKDIGIDVKQKTEELNTFVTTLSAGMGKDTAKNLGSLIFARAEKEWARDPFLDEKSFKAWARAKEVAKELPKETAAAPKIEFVYSGYVETNRKRMAIINGVEYQEGENLDIKGYVLKSASPSSVVIENRGIGATVNVPLLE